MKERYKWKSEYEGLYRGKDAQKVGEEIKSLSGKDGDKPVKPQEIVEYARNNKASELYKCFEWNDSLAAERYRLVQARNVVNSIIYVVETVEEGKEPQKVKVFMQTEYGSGYQPTEVIVKNEDKYQKLLQQAYKDLKVFKERYYMLTELKEIFDLIP